MGQGSSAIGKKIENDFKWVGNKIGEGWETTKAWGKKTYEDIKKIPVIGNIASAIEQSPIGTGWRGLTGAIDTGVQATSKILQGDLKGGISRITQGGRDFIGNIQNDNLVKTAVNLPGVGEILKNTPVFGGMSYNNLSQIGNSALNALDSVKDGRFNDALSQGLDVGKSLASKGVGGQNLQKAVDIGTKVQKGVNVANKLLNQ